jgi:hypothetical protein
MKLITEQKLKDQHLYYIIDVNRLDAGGRFNRYLDRILKVKSHCDNCGSIQPEIKFYRDGKCFTFTCIEITEEKTEKVITQTNFQTLCNYLFFRGYGPKTLIEVKALLKFAKEKATENIVKVKADARS